MKRKQDQPGSQRPAKKARPEVPEYHLTPSVKDEDGDIIWPAPKDQMSRARDIIKGCAASGKKTLIVPDKDADGLTSGAILYRTLMLLGLPEDQIAVHLLTKGDAVHSPAQRERMSKHDPAFVFVLDQGSRASEPLVSNEHTCLVIDHHHATASDFPTNASYVTACNSPPVSTSSLLTYLLCLPLHPSVEESCNWLAIVGTHGDLGNTLKWKPPFPDMSAPLKQYTKKTLNDIVSLINAPRRTATYDVIAAWTALLAATKEGSQPKDILSDKRLREARDEINDEVERATHAAPKFSADGTIAVLRINSKAQVHPVIATRWAGHLNSKALRIVMVANEGYLEGKVNFSCRTARCARARGDDVDIIKELKAYANLPPPPPPPQSPSSTSNDHEKGGDATEAQQDEPVAAPQEAESTTLLERLGESFARGHVQASGGIVDRSAFEELMARMRVGEKKAASTSTAQSNGTTGASPSKKNAAKQSNTLMNYFGKGAGTQGKGVAVDSTS